MSPEAWTPGYPRLRRVASVGHMLFTAYVTRDVARTAVGAADHTGVYGHLAADKQRTDIAVRDIAAEVNQEFQACTIQSSRLHRHGHIGHHALNQLVLYAIDFLIDDLKLGCLELIALAVHRLN